MIFASERQIDYIESLFSTIKEGAPKANAETQQLIQGFVEKHLDNFKALGTDRKISMSDAKEMIEEMRTLKPLLQTGNRWTKVGSEFYVVGPDVVAGATIQVESSKGVKQVTIASVMPFGGISHGLPAKIDTDGIELGFYLNTNDEIIRVKETKKGIKIAERIGEDGSKVYLGKAGLAGLGQKLTLEDAKAFGHRTGRCMICCRELTNPESIANGIGPVCLDGWA